MIAIITRFGEIVVEFSTEEERERIADFIRALFTLMPIDQVDYCKSCGAPAILQNPPHIIPPPVVDDDIPF